MVGNGTDWRQGVISAAEDCWISCSQASREACSSGLSKWNGKSATAAKPARPVSTGRSGSRTSLNMSHPDPFEGANDMKASRHSIRFLS